MQTLPRNWYRILNYVLGVGQVLMMATFGWLQFSDPSLAASIGFTAVSVTLLALGAVASLIAAPFIAKKSPFLASIISFFITVGAISSLVGFGGGVSSVFYPLVILIGFAAGMFGIALALLYLSMVGVGVGVELLGLVESNVSLTHGVILIVANVLAVGLGYMLWRSHFITEPEDSRVSNLTTKLEAEQLRSEILFNAIGEGVIATDVSGKIQLINPAAARITDWNQEDAFGLDVTSVMRLVKIDKEEQEVELDSYEHPFAQAISKQHNITLDDAMLSTQTNKRVELSITVSPIVINDQVQGAVAVFRDVTEQRKQERQRAEFISTASHEMRTPVAAIEGYLALAMNENVATIDSKARGYLEKAHESTTHLGQLFKDLLTAAKSEDGRLTNHPEVVEMNDLLKKITDDLRFSAEEKGLNLIYTTAPDDESKIKLQRVAPLFYAYVDPERIREVITNLITNAIKFTEEGQITVGVRANQESIQVTVADTGYGIPEEDIPHLFQKFYRVDNSATRTIGGTGLGLFISRNIIEMYKGRIWVESELGQGSTFYINLPRLSSQQATELKERDDAASAPLQVEQTI